MSSLGRETALVEPEAGNCSVARRETRALPASDRHSMILQPPGYSLASAASTRYLSTLLTASSHLQFRTTT